jgi:toxin YoeB
MLSILFRPEGWEDYVYWQNQDRKTLKKINYLIGDMTRSPFDGIGKPEPLKGDLSGFWSRRIDDKNRITYKVMDEYIIIYTCKSHYE